MKNILKTKYFLPLIILVAVTSYFIFIDAPAYTRWAVVLIVLPSLFFIFRKESTIDMRKLSVISIIGIIMGLIWDHVAMKFQIWDFPSESISGWFLGIPLEEYIFAIGFPIIILGIYTSLPRFKSYKLIGLRFFEAPLLISIFLMQLLVWLFIFYSNAQSYIQWLLFLVILPSLFYLWRRGEKIDEIRMGIVILFLIIATIITDLIFIQSGSWFHYDVALLGRIGLVPIDDILFSIFVGISVVGLYTSLPQDNIWKGKW